MNPTLNEPNVWMEINFSSLLSKSQSFDEVSYRKAKKMRLFNEQKSVYDVLKEKQGSLNMNPSAVVDMYNNPVGYYMNQVAHDVRSIPAVYANAADLNSDLAVIEKPLPPMVPVNRFDDQSNPSLIVNEEFSYAGPSDNLQNGPYVDLSPVAYHFFPPLPESCDYDDIPVDVPVGFDCASELKRIYNSRRYSGFKDYFLTLKKIYPFIEQIRSKSQLSNWFTYNHYVAKKQPDYRDQGVIPAPKNDERKITNCNDNTGSLAVPFENGHDKYGLQNLTDRVSVDGAVKIQPVPDLSDRVSVDDCVEIQPIPEGFDYTSAIHDEFVNGNYVTAAPFIDSFVKKFPFILAMKTRKQILHSFKWEKVKRAKGKVSVGLPRKQENDKLSIAAPSTYVNVRVPEGFDYFKEFLYVFKNGNHKKASLFLDAIKTKFPFILNIKTAKQIRGFFYNRKRDKKLGYSASEAADCVSSVASFVEDSVSDVHSHADSDEIFNRWLEEDCSELASIEALSMSPKSNSFPECVPESPDLAVMPSSLSPDSVTVDQKLSLPPVVLGRPIDSPQFAPDEILSCQNEGAEYRIKPSPTTDTTSKARNLYIGNENYAHKWKNIYPAYEAPVKNPSHVSRSFDPHYQQKYDRAYQDDNSKNFSYARSPTDSYFRAIVNSPRVSGDDACPGIVELDAKANTANQDHDEKTTQETSIAIEPPQTSDGTRSPTEQKVPSFDLSEHSEFFNTPSMKFLDQFFEETLFG